jgi:hypothetical protein
MKIFLIIYFLFWSFFYVNSQTIFQKAYGGSARNWATSVKQTSDGGYIMTGIKNYAETVNEDIYLIKTDSYGDTIWTKIFGGTDDDYSNSVKQTNDGGYIIVGTTYSFGGNSDAYLIKTDSFGNLEWSKTYGGGDFDAGTSIEQTNDGGYILLGSTNSFVFGAWLLKLNMSGNIVWKKIFQNTFPRCAKQTNDNGYIILGTIDSLALNGDVLLIKTNINGGIVWTKSIGGPRTEYPISIQQTNDKGYIIVGSSWSFSSINAKKFLIKTDSLGNTLWSKIYGEQNGTSVHQTPDNGYIISGTSGDLGANRTDACLIKTDSLGNVNWSKAFGSENYDNGTDAEPTSDGGYVLMGSFGMTNGGFVNEKFYLIKTDQNGNSQCNQSNLVPNDSTVIFTEKVPIINVYTWGLSAIPITQVGSGCIVEDLCTVGISELFNYSRINVFPNPTSNMISITGITEKTTIRLYDVIGKLVFEKEAENNTTINTGFLTAGVYKLLTENKTCRKFNTVLISR